MLLFLAGCERNTVFEGKKDFSGRYWVFNNPAVFDFEIEDTEQAYDLTVHVRNSSEYQYQNIYLQYYLEDESGRLLSEDLKNIQLFHPVTGVPVGSGLGDIHQVERVFLESYQFENEGKYTFRIDQFMRQDSLPEVISVGLKVALSE
jgi:gliding motility-associated lipoprotein GldH